MANFILYKLCQLYVVVTKQKTIINTTEKIHIKMKILVPPKVKTHIKKCLPKQNKEIYILQRGVQQ